jgi:hypothetical protein
LERRRRKQKEVELKQREKLILIDGQPASTPYPIGLDAKREAGNGPIFSRTKIIFSLLSAIAAVSPLVAALAMCFSKRS